MKINPGMELLAEGMIQPLGDGLTPGDDYPIEVPESGGIIIQSADAFHKTVLPNGGIIQMDQNGSIVG